MTIRIEGAAEHNLKNVDVEIGDGLTVVTGVSGSGKTSLVFDTLYHEARRRFLEIFSLGERLAPADVRSIAGLGPAVAVGQNLLNRNPGSTLATASGLHPFMRLLYANFGERVCATCGAAISVATEDEIVERIGALVSKSPALLLAPLLRRALGSHRTLLAALADTFGADALWVDGSPVSGGRLPALLPNALHDLDVEIAWLPALAGDGHGAAAVRQAVGQVWALGASAVVVRRDDYADVVLSRAPVCARCGAWFSDLRPVHFHQSCTFCEGKGCDRCGGTGLHHEAAAVRWQGLRLPDLLRRSVSEARRLFADAGLPPAADRLQAEINRRLEALDRVGLGYIALDRPSPTLSRGESQRVRLAVALTGRLEDILHVLDEPTIGQHPADVARFLPAFRDLRGPVVFVEHDRIAAAAADRALDLGPGAGGAGGEVVFSGSPAALWEADTATGRYFSLRERVMAPEPRPAPEAFLVVRSADLRNLRGIDIPLPISRLTVITGVSGSGKSTFVEDVLSASLKGKRPQGCASIDGPRLKAVIVDQSPIGRNPRSNPATYTKLSDLVRDAFATATGLSKSHFSFNRPEGACPACKGIGAVEVKMRYLPSTWLPCGACEGQRFSDEVLEAAASFGGEELSIADVYRLTISEVGPLLRDCEHLTVKQQRSAGRILRALNDIGLGYLTLGQPSPTLSGGEAQRVKLAKYLGRRRLSRQMLILDEPSTGLHPQDVSGLLTVLDRLVRSGATIVIVEHNTDIIRAADWIVDLGPGAGPEGGDLIYAGPPDGLMACTASHTARALREEDEIRPRRLPDAVGGVARDQAIRIVGATANNLRDVDVSFPKGCLTVVTGVSGSGKSSLVSDVLESEARRRFLETLSMYERQGTREGPEAEVQDVTGLGVAVTVTGGGRGAYGRRNTVGLVTEIDRHRAVLFSWLGERPCPECGTPMVRRTAGRRLARRRRAERWRCPQCKATYPVAAPRHFSPSVYAAACTTCHGVGTLRKPNPGKLIIHPEKPLCDGAMYSPGFFPKGYLCKPYNGGYSVVQALARDYGFNPATTPWNEMTPEAQQAFLYGVPEKLEVVHENRKGEISTHHWRYPGFYGWVGDWDTGGTYTDTERCPDCEGARLRSQYAAVTLQGQSFHALSQLTLVALAEVVATVDPSPVRERSGETAAVTVATSLEMIRKRLRFLLQVGLGYLDLDRDAATLSAGEAQRVKLAGLLGSGLTSLTVLMDEPTRGMHPTEVDALVGALQELRSEGNTVIVVEHDPSVMRAADYLVDMGPGPGVAGGEVVAAGTPDAVLATDTVTARWLTGRRGREPREGRGIPQRRRVPKEWLMIRGARAHNLQGEDVRLPKGVLVGVCGVSGSGKSTLVIDTLGRALAPRKHTTSVASMPIDPGAHDAIEGAPKRVMLVDQVKAGVYSPAHFLRLTKPLHRIYADTEDARVLGLDAKALGARCSACRGSGTTRIDMAFLPNVHVPCETCQGTGYRPEAWDVRLHGVPLPRCFEKTLDEVYELLRPHFDDVRGLQSKLDAARDVGLGYLVLRQPGYALSGGEAQRLKIAGELARNGRSASKGGTLYILDEPTVGQHLEDVGRLGGVLHRLVDARNTVIVVEHHVHLLALCDWLLELGPGGGPDGGRVIAEGTPEQVVAAGTPTGRYLREVLP